MAERSKTRLRSIQGEGGRRRKAGHKSHVAKLNDQAMAKATRHGLSWDDEDVELLVRMIDADEKTLDMALALGRSFYAAQVARSHVGFIMRHQAAFDRARAAVAAPKRTAQRKERKRA